MPTFDPPVINEALTQNAAKVAGLVERVTYHNAENGFCVLRLKVRGHREGMPRPLLPGNTRRRWGLGWRIASTGGS